MNVSKFLHLLLFYSFLRYLPASTTPIVGKLCRHLRYLCCRKIFKYCGHNVNIERKSFFGRGTDIEIGDNSGLGINCTVPNDIVIGRNVMMGPNCYVLSRNHCFDRTDIPMIDQGYSKSKKTVIEDDVWIGRNVVFTSGRLVQKGSIIAISSVLTKDYPEYAVVGGNPARLIKHRN